jgi:hypothetical protein
MDGEGALRLSFTGGSSRLILLYQSAFRSPESLAFGFSSPWVRFGPLSPAGLLRETENPLGYGPGSGVNDEKTELTVDGSLPPGRRLSLFLAPLPGSLALFSRQSESPQIGGLAVLQAGPCLSAEALVELSRPPARRWGEEWFAGVPPFPGGEILHLAGRATWRAPSLVLSVSACLSECQWAPAGVLFDSQLALGGESLAADLIFGTASPQYVTMRGTGSREGLVGGARLRIKGQDGSAVFRYLLGIGHPEYAWHPFLESRQERGFTFETVLWGSLRDGLALQIGGQSETDFDHEGRATENADCRLAVAWSRKGEPSSIDVAVAREGVKLSWDIGFGGRGIFCTAEGSIGSRSGGAATALFSLRAEGKEGISSVSAGIQGMPLGGGLEDPLSRLLLKLEWRTRMVLRQER